MALGTGQTTGPYTPVSGTPITVSDPSTGVPSNKVQIQNASGFSLSVQVGGLPYSVQPQTATTILTNNEGASITITPSSTVANQTGSITLVWLLAGQDSPIPDGFMGQSIANQRIGGTYSIGTTVTTTISLLATDQSITLFFSMSSSPVEISSYSITGTSSGILYASGSIYGAIGTTQYTVGPITVYGAIDPSVNVTVTNIYGAILPVTMTVVLGSSPGGQTTPIGGGTKIGVGQYTYGGKLRVGNPALSSGTAVVMLAAPGAGYSYRLHSWAFFGVLNTGASSFIALLDSSVTLATMTSAAEPGFQYLGGLLVVNDQVRVSTNTGSYSAGGIVLAYDLIQTPTIT